MFPDPNIKRMIGLISAGAADCAQHLLPALPAAEETPGDQWSDSQECWPKRGESVSVLPLLIRWHAHVSEKLTELEKKKVWFCSFCQSLNEELHSMSMCAARNWDDTGNKWEPWSFESYKQANTWMWHLITAEYFMWNLKCH